MGFEWNSEAETYDFRLGDLAGQLTPLGWRQGITSLVNTNQSAGTPGKPAYEWVGVNAKDIPGYRLSKGDGLFLLDLYHYLATNLKPGTIGRAMRGEHSVSGNGETVTVRLEASDECAIRTEATYRLAKIALGDESLPLITVSVDVRPDRPYQDFELWLSSYCPDRRNGAHFHTCDGHPSKGCHRFFKPELEKNEALDGYYLCFPRDNHAAALNYDGRWGNAEYQTFLTCTYYGEPIVAVVDPVSEYAYVEMSTREHCAKLCGSCAADPVPGAGDDTRMYTVLFGHDVVPGQVYTATVAATVLKLDGNFERLIDLQRTWSNSLRTE